MEEKNKISIPKNFKGKKIERLRDKRRVEKEGTKKREVLIKELIREKSEFYLTWKS